MIGNSTIPNPGIENSSPGLQSLLTLSIKSFYLCIQLQDQDRQTEILKCTGTQASMPLVVGGPDQWHGCLYRQCTPRTQRTHYTGTSVFDSSVTSGFHSILYHETGALFSTLFFAQHTLVCLFFLYHRPN